MSQLDVMSKLNTKTSFIHGLHDEGRQAAGRWLEKNFHMLGLKSSFDLGRYLQ
jgi:NTE family protein